jgi:hypothetical protein
MDTLYLSARRPSSPYRNVNVQLQQWQNSNRLSEVSHVMPQNTFTQVTIAAYQRKNSCHGDFAITHHNSDTERQRGHLMRNSICDKNPRGKSLRARSYYSQAESINAIDQTQNSPPMLCSTSSYLFRPHQSEPYWTGSSFASQKHFPDDGGARFAPLGCPSPYVVGGFPPTPADTVHAEDFPPKNSSNNSESTIFSPRSKLETGSYEVAPGICAKNPGTAETAVEEQQGSENLLTPPPETTACSAGRNTQVFDEHTQAAVAAFEYKASPDADMDGNGRTYIGLSTAPVVGEDSDLEFLSSEWDPNNLDFLDNENGFAPSFMSNQGTGWDTRHLVLPSAYPAPAPDSSYSTNIGVGPASFHAQSTFASEKSPEYQFDQFGGYLSAQSNLTGLESFHNSFPTFETHPFSVQPASASPTNDRTSNRSKSKDQMLVDLKQRGYSYKDIKVMGQFEEAESTLRGRYRTLTKPKEARVRKPEWGDREASLTLKHLVRRFVLT